MGPIIVTSSIITWMMEQGRRNRCEKNRMNCWYARCTIGLCCHFAACEKAGDLGQQGSSKAKQRQMRHPALEEEEP